MAVAVAASFFVKSFAIHSANTSLAHSVFADREKLLGEIRRCEGVEVEFPEKLTRSSVLAAGYGTLWSAFNISGKYRIQSEF